MIFERLVKGGSNGTMHHAIWRAACIKRNCVCDKNDLGYEIAIINIQFFFRKSDSKTYDEDVAYRKVGFLVIQNVYQQH